VGLGPAGIELVTSRTLDLIAAADVVRLRTRIHPAASAFTEVASYDDWYERATSFEELYEQVANDLVALALSSSSREVLYVVPGSPVVAERTVELLRERAEVHVVTEAAVSVIDVVCAALGRDPMAGLRTIDALASDELLRGPGPLLVLQAYAPEVLATVASRLPATTAVTVLHHVGLEDEQIVTLAASELSSFAAADHLTSLWIDELRTAGDATDDLVELTRRLRAECPWDAEQDHASLTRYLLEEAYEALDALEAFVRAQAQGEDLDAVTQHVQEELGDLLIQIMLHGELGDEEGLFNFTSVADGVRVKMIGRHPHVFGDVTVSGADEVVARWEVLKHAEKGRTSVTDGIAWQLPALSLYAKLLDKAARVQPSSTLEQARSRAIEALNSLALSGDGAGDEQSNPAVESAWGDVLTSIVECAKFGDVDLEGLLRERATMLRDEIRRRERDEPVENAAPGNLEVDHEEMT
jgi:tetrapyrrole methylase family protein/MazG family protein